MTEQIPEGAEQAGPVMDVKIEGSITDGVFRIDSGVEDIALVTLHFNSAGGDIMEQLLAVVGSNWAAVYEQIVEGYEAALAAEPVEEARHRLDEEPLNPEVAPEETPESAIEAAEEIEVVQTTVGEGIS